MNLCYPQNKLYEIRLINERHVGAGSALIEGDHSEIELNPPRTITGIHQADIILHKPALDGEQGTV